MAARDDGVRSLPEEFDVALLEHVLGAGWGLTPSSIDYAPVGFGSYHWTVLDVDGRRLFVTVDDLDRKPWFGKARGPAFAGLCTAFATAHALRHDRGLSGVVAPILSLDGAPAQRVGDRHAVAVFPYVDAPGGDFGQALGQEAGLSLLELLAELHSASLPAVPTRIDVPALGRGDLEQALAERDQPWRDGPYAEPVRDWLRSHAGALVEQLRELDRLTAAVRHLPRVVTHGEPHPGNVLFTVEGLLLIDWDTVALAPRERDLWLAADGEGDLAAYAARTGHTADQDALTHYRLAWDVSDVAAYVTELRGAEERTEDREASWGYLTDRSL